MGGVKCALRHLEQRCECKHMCKVHEKKTCEVYLSTTTVWFLIPVSLCLLVFLLHCRAGVPTHASEVCQKVFVRVLLCEPCCGRLLLNDVRSPHLTHVAVDRLLLNTASCDASTSVSRFEGFPPLLPGTSLSRSSCTPSTSHLHACSSQVHRSLEVRTTMFF